MSAGVWQIVDRVDDAADVLLDLHDGQPWRVTDWSCPPPELRRYAQTSALYDGSVESGSSYDDRTLTLTLDLYVRDVSGAGDGDGAIEAYANLARLLDRPQWLRYQPADGSTGVFFRLRRNSPGSIDEKTGTQAGKRGVTLTLAAEPFAYGPQISDTVTIANDPTVTNGLVATLPEIVGDVETSLVIRTFTSGTERPIDVIALASRSSSNAVGANAITDLNAGGDPAVTVSTQSDTNAWGGDYVRFAGTGTGTFLLYVNGSVPAGDYRLFARMRKGQIANADGRMVGTASSTTWNMSDLGVFRAGGRRLIPGFDSWGTQPTQIQVNATRNVEIDAIVMVPVSLDLDVASRLRFATLGVTSGFSNLPIDADRDTNPLSEGGYPVVVPGAVNELRVIIGILGKFINIATWPADNKTYTTTLLYTYYPRYLYARTP